MAWTTTAGNNDEEKEKNKHEIRRSVVTWTIEAGNILHGPCSACRSHVDIINGIYTPKKMVFQNEHFRFFFYIYISQWVFGWIFLSNFLTLGLFVNQLKL